MAVPRDPTLRAAVRWLEHLPSSGSTRLRALFASAKEFSDLTPTQYAEALAWLRRTGLVDGRDRPTDPALRAPTTSLAIYEAAVEHSAAPWLANADQLVCGPAELPEDALKAAEALNLDSLDAFAVLQRAWGKVDTAERERVGSAGELGLLEMLAAITDGEVRHVAAYADGYGYDISVTAPGLTAHLEVKSTTSRAQLRIYLSRNEYETMLRDPHWTLTAVRLDRDLQPAAVACVSRKWIEDTVPADRYAAGRWESARLTVPPEAITPGLPTLARAVSPTKAPLIHGLPTWPGTADVLS